MKESDLLNLRKIDCDLEGHPTPVSPEFFASFLLSCCLMGLQGCKILIFVVPCIFQKLDFVDVATGSLGQGLGAACGMAYTGKNFDKSRLESVELN